MTRAARAVAAGPATVAAADLDAVRARWADAWPQALAAWGRFTRLHAPVLHGADDVPGGVGSFAWFSCTEVEVHIDLADVLRRGLGDHAVAVLAHEVGHHVLSPGDLSTSARLVARARDGLIDLPAAAPVVANLWSDLLVNDRLQRRAGLDLAGLWTAIGPPAADDVVMQLVARTNELLWSLPSGTLTRHGAPVPEAEAGLCARLVRAYADDPAGGIGGFAALVRRLAGPVTEDDGATSGASGATGAGSGDALGDALRRLRTRRPTACTQHGEAGGQVIGLSDDPALGTPVLHPALDPRVVGRDGRTVVTEPEPDPGTRDTPLSPGRGTGQALSPADYHAILAQLGVTTTLEESARRWYREQAQRHLVPFPVRTTPATVEPLLGAHEQWDVGDELGDVDWTATVLRSPVVVPGVTTVQRAYDDSPGQEASTEPVDLDLYLDSSGSMPDPRARVAPVALAGAVLALSALRAGARVQATTWSGPQQVAGTDGFTRDPDAVLTAVVAYFGGGTTFPLPLLERTHLADGAEGGPPGSRGAGRRRPCHLAVISDSGVTSMFGHGQAPGSDTIAPRALAAAGGGGSLVLCVDEGYLARVRELAVGYDVYRVEEWEDMVAFARDFARRTWAREGAGPGVRR